MVSPLPPDQEQAARMLASGASVSVTAHELGLDPATLHLWRRRPHFGNRLAELLTEAEEIAAFRMRALGGWALEQLVRLAADDSVAAATRERILSRLLEQSRLTAAARAKDLEDMDTDDVVGLVASLPQELVEQALERMGAA